MKFKIGDKVLVYGVIVEVGDDGFIVRHDSGRTDYYIKKDINLLPNREVITWDNIAVGDKVRYKNGNEEEIARIEVYKIYYTHDHESLNDQSIKDGEWSIVQPEEVTELTVAECAKKLGVKNLKIVE